MKKRIPVLLISIAVSAAFLAGCEASKGLETDAIKITQYKGVEVDQVQKPDEITDEKVEQSIQSTLEAQAEEEEVTDRPVEEGDIVNIDFVGKIDGKAFDGGSAQKYDLTIGSDSFIDGFEDSIIGHEIGDEFDWDGKFPDDYDNADYAGKDVVFTITVNSITKRTVPELTDELVVKLSDDAKTVKEYKAEIKKQLEDVQQQNYDTALSSEVWNKVIENTEVKKYPDGAKEKMEDFLRKLYELEAKQYGMELKDYVETQGGMTEEDFNAQILEPAAEQNVKSRMATEAIAEKEKIELSEEEYEKQLQELIENSSEEYVEGMKQALGEEDFEEELRITALNDLVLEKLTEQCIQTASGK